LTGIWPLNRYTAKQGYHSELHTHTHTHTHTHAHTHAYTCIQNIAKQWHQREREFSRELFEI
jgi:hypothetical protein